MTLHIDDAKAVGVSTVPSFLIDGTLQAGFQTADQMRALLDARLAAVGQ